jgi:hypothetical protein
MKTFLAIIKKILFVLGGSYLWFTFAFQTLYRDEWALKSTGGNPLPNEWTFILLPVMFAIIFNEGFNLKGFWKFIFISVIVILSLIGMLFFMTTMSAKP